MTPGYEPPQGQSWPAGAAPQLAVIILNWNGWRDTIECLESVYRSHPPWEWQVVVVDNGSTDESIEKIQDWAEGRLEVSSKLFKSERRAHPIPYLVSDQSGAEVGNQPPGKESALLPRAMSLIIIRVPENLGYAGGNNVGIRYTLRGGFPYIGLLNNDTVVDPEMLGGLVSYLNQNEGVGIVGVKTLYYDDPGVIWCAGTDLNLFLGKAPFRGYGHPDGPDFSGTCPIDVVGGHALFARREVFEKVGLLDEDMFLIWEDTELCLRASRRSSLRICMNLDVRLWHKSRGISSSGAVSPTATYFANRNRMKVVWGYGTWPQRIGFLCFYLASRLPKFFRLILAGQFTLVRAECRALAHALLGRMGSAAASGPLKSARGDEDR